MPMMVTYIWKAYLSWRTKKTKIKTRAALLYDTDLCTWNIKVIQILNPALTCHAAILSFRHFAIQQANKTRHSICLQIFNFKCLWRNEFFKTKKILFSNQTFDFSTWDYFLTSNMVCIIILLMLKRTANET